MISGRVSFGKIQLITRRLVALSQDAPRGFAIARTVILSQPLSQFPKFGADRLRNGGFLGFFQSDLDRPSPAKTMMGVNPLGRIGLYSLQLAAADPCSARDGRAAAIGGADRQSP